MDRHVRGIVPATAGSNGSPEAVPRPRLREGTSQGGFIKWMEITSVLSLLMLAMLILLAVWEYM